MQLQITINMYVKHFFNGNNGTAVLFYLFIIILMIDARMRCFLEFSSRYLSDSEDDHDNNITIICTHAQQYLNSLNSFKSPVPD